MRLRTIGGLWIEGGAPRAPLGPRPLSLLALVAAAGRKGISRERAVGILWADTDENQARHALSQTLYRLKRDTGRDWFTPTAELRLDLSVSSDIGSFHEALAKGDLEAATGLYTGAFLEGFYLPGAPEFERWVEEERDRLHHQALRALERLAARSDESRLLPQAVRSWHRLTELDPLSARYAMGYLRALAAAGDRPRALAHAQLYRETVRRELDTEPDPALRQLEAALRAPPLEEPAEPPASTGPQIPSPEPAPVQRVALPGKHWMAPVALVGMVLLGLALRGVSTASDPPPPFLAVGRIRTPALGDTSSLGPVLRDMLATSLGSIRGLQVVANSRLIELMPRGADSIPGATADAARRAGATEILEGELVPGGTALALVLRRVALTSGVVRQGYSVHAMDPSQLVDSATTAIARDLRLEAPPAAVATIRTSSPAAYALYEEGLRAFYRWDGAAAYRLMRAAVERDSGFAMAAYYGWWASRGIMSDPQGDGDLLRLAKLLAPRAIDRERLLIEGSVATMVAPLSTALAIAETLAVRYPDDPDGQILLGGGRRHAGDWAGAIAAYERAVTLDSLASATPGSYCRLCVALGGIGAAYAWWDSAGAAERTARRFISVRPQEGIAWSALIEPLLRLGRREEALAAIQKRDSLATVPYSDRGLLQRDLIRWGRFEELDRQLLDDLVSSSVSVRNEGRWLMLFSLRNQGRLREAMALARDHVIPGSSSRVIGLPPEGLMQSTISLEARRPLEAARGFRQVAAISLSQNLTPGFKARFVTWMLALAGTALASAGDTAAVHRLADSAEQIGKGSNWGRDPRLHHYLRGLLFQRNGHHAQAVEAFRRALFSTSDGFTRINLEMGRSLVALGRAWEAIAILQPALRGGVDGSNSYVTYTELHEALAQAFELAGRPDSAVAHYRAVERAWRHADPHLQDRYRQARLKAGV